MTAHAPNDPPQDEEIIELTDVVEEPSEPGPESGEQSAGAPEQTRGSKAGADSDDAAGSDEEFDFSTLFDEDEFSDSAFAEVEEDMSASSEQAPAGDPHDEPFAGIDDIFEELDLDISSDQSSSARDEESALTDPGRLQELEQRVQELENAAASPGKDTWKDIEERIMRRLEQLVDEKIKQATQDLKQDVQVAVEQSAAAYAGRLEEMADTVQELNQNSVGPETVAALKNELWTELTQRMEDAIPRLAAQVIRREIQTLLEEESPASEGLEDDPA